eukprot:scaffold2404_cov398-Prasinococcus_capsulatus_cf.AAC.15
MTCLSSCVGAWSDRASFTSGASLPRARIRGTTPTVETVMCRGARPKHLVITPMASRTAS